MKKTYSLNDGKYKIIRDTETYAAKALRYDEPWRDIVGDKLIHSLLDRIDELEKKVSDYGWEASAWHAQNTGGTM